MKRGAALRPVAADDARRIHEQDFRLSHELLAVMLGVRRPTVTLVASTLQQAGSHLTAFARETVRERQFASIRHI